LTGLSQSHRSERYDKSCWPDDATSNDSRIFFKLSFGRDGRDPSFLCAKLM
jgi:hypothetical protein